MMGCFIYVEIFSTRGGGEGNKDYESRLAAQKNRRDFLELGIYLYFYEHIHIGQTRGSQRDGRLSWLTNGDLVYEPKCGGGGVAGSQPMSTAVHRSPNKLRRSNLIFNLWVRHILEGALARQGTASRARAAHVTPPYSALFTYAH